MQRGKRVTTNQADQLQAEQLQATVYSYDLLGSLFLEGVTAETLPYIRSIAPQHDMLGLSVPEGTEESELLELAAAEHMRLFGFQLFPFQSLFLGDTRQVGGTETNRLFALYERSGFAPDTSSESPDHVGFLLQFFSFLCEQERRAGDDAETAAHWQRLQLECLDEHALCWMPGLLHGVQLNGNPLYRDLAELALALLVTHRKRLFLALPREQQEASFVLQDAPDILSSSKTGMRDIAGYLLTPAWSGLTLSRDEIKHVSHTRHVPSGFGQRLTMLTNVLRSAVEYDELPEVTTLLKERCREWEAFYTGLERFELPTLTAVSHQWRERVRLTMQLLERIAQETLALYDAETGTQTWSQEAV
jgi:TorA maturation chaperone TorD